MDYAGTETAGICFKRGRHSFTVDDLEKSAALGGMYIIQDPAGAVMTLYAKCG
jgi:hypothetical protein